MHTLVETKKLIADKIKHRLKELGVNRKQFAGLMNVQPSVVTRWLSGKHNFQMFTLFEIERILNMELFDFNIQTEETKFLNEFI